MPEWPQAVYDALGPEPRKPTAAEKADPDANREVLSAWRDYAAQAMEVVDNSRKGGGTLESMGLKNEVGAGKWLFDRDKAIDAYGEGGADARWTMDWVHGRMRKKKGVGLDESEGWITIPKSFYDERRQAQRSAKFGGRENYLGHQGVKEMLRYGHLNKDPVTGLFFNIGTGNPQDPSTWQWKDQYGHAADLPQGINPSQILQANAAQVTGAGGTGPGSSAPPPAAAGPGPNDAGYWDSIFGLPGYQNPEAPAPVSNPPAAQNPLAPLNASVPSSAPPTSATPPISPLSVPGGPETPSNPIAHPKYWSATLPDPDSDGRVTIEEILASAGDNVRKQKMTDYLTQIAGSGGVPDYNYLYRIGLGVGTNAPPMDPGPNPGGPPRPPIIPQNGPPPRPPIIPQNVPFGSSAAPSPKPVAKPIATTPFSGATNVLSKPARSFTSPQSTPRPSFSLSDYSQTQSSLRRKPQRVGFGL